MKTLKKRCFTRLIISKNEIEDCPNKPYGKLRQDSKWYVYCRSCYYFQLKNNPDLWIDKRVIKNE